MLKIITFFLVTLIYFNITACTSIDAPQTNNSITQWDFDHQVQFIQTNLTKNSYLLEIIPNNKINFERLATFLLRKSYSLCGSYHYKLEMAQGIEGFDSKRAMPSYIFPSLIAKVECNNNQTN